MEEIDIVRNKIDVIEKIQKYVHQEITHITEDIRDYIDDDYEGNKSIIQDLREQREHWKDIERIIEGNENLYMNWEKLDMTEEEKDIVEGIKENPTSRELMLIHIIERLDEENEELKDLKAELQAEVIKNHYLEDIVKVYEQQIDLEWVEENYIEKRILKRAEKVIDLMAEHISKYGKVCTFNYGATRPEQWIEYFTKKVEEENE